LARTSTILSAPVIYRESTGRSSAPTRVKWAWRSIGARWEAIPQVAPAAKIPAHKSCTTEGAVRLVGRSFLHSAHGLRGEMENAPDESTTGVRVRTDEAGHPERLCRACALTELGERLVLDTPR
jgi:hypothetical protein